MKLTLPRIPRPSWPRRKPRDASRQAPRPVPHGALRAFRAGALWAIAVIITAASGAAFAESYRGLYDWALKHGLSGFWGAAFPLQVDSFIAVGELALFIATVDAWTWRQRCGAWSVALLGLAASVMGNVGHIAAHDLQSRGTAAVPPLAAFAAMWVGLAILKRVIARTDPAATESLVLPEIPTDAEVAALIALRASTWASNPLSARQLETRFGLTRAQSTKVRQAATAGANGHGTTGTVGDAVS